MGALAAASLDLQGGLNTVSNFVNGAINDLQTLF